MNRILLIFSLLVAVVCVACSDDESFTIDRGATLRFSADTVAFDTVVSSIGSPTKRLIVYNDNDRGVRLVSVALKKGAGSAFRMNVDGQFGARVEDVEIAAHDSIFVFLEATVAEGEEAFKLAADSVLFGLESGVRQHVVLEAVGIKAKSMRGVVVGNDMTLTADLPCLIYDSLVVAEGARLTVEAGAMLCFHKGASLVVHGSLSIEGEAGREVTLRGDRFDRLLPYLPYDRIDGQWGGVALTPSCAGCDIRFADIHGGNFGLLCDSIAGSLRLENSTIHNVAGDALMVSSAGATVANSQLSNAGGYCVNLVNAKADIYHCTVAQFYPWHAGGGCAVMIKRLEDERTDWDEATCNFYNCMITGYADDEVFAEFNADRVALGAHFFSCVVNTDVSDEKYFTDCVSESKDNAVWKDGNFQLVDTHDFIYDFHLKDESVARNKANNEYTLRFPVDRMGNERSMDKANDCGCFAPRPQKGGGGRGKEI